MDDSLKWFALGGVSGAIGVTGVYPIDLIKTRMQHQTRLNPKYTSSWDCFTSVIRKEGVLGLYKGLKPQLIGVSPEKAIKLTVNDTLRKVYKGEKTLPFEIIAGGAAGLSQVIFTNPLEIVKIRLQVMGEKPKEQQKSAIKIMSELKLKGLYKGSLSCILRDVPFSAIYFPLYESLKKRFTPPDGVLSMGMGFFLSGTLAGFVAASITTPFDMIKTRLQADQTGRKVQYNSVPDCFKKVVKHEGPSALFKGMVPRVCRSAPQFGITLLVYEQLKSAVKDHQ